MQSVSHHSPKNSPDRHRMSLFVPKFAQLQKYTDRPIFLSASNCSVSGNTRQTRLRDFLQKCCSKRRQTCIKLHGEFAREEGWFGDNRKFQKAFSA